MPGTVRVYRVGQQVLIFFLSKYYYEENTFLSTEIQFAKEFWAKKQIIMGDPLSFCQHYTDVDSRRQFGEFIKF